MSTLKELLEFGRGVYRAFFDETDLGTLAVPPEVKAEGRHPSLTIRDTDAWTRTQTGEPELRAEIRLKLKSVYLGFSMLSDPPASGRLRLINSDRRRPAELDFPVCRLLPEWEFAPSFIGDHLLTVHFLAEADDEGRLFYFTGA